MVNSGQSIQFFCSKCNTTFLKESAFLDMPGTSEECPSCGHQLSETLHVQRPAKPRQSLTLQTAYEMGATLTLGMEEIDSFLDLRLGDRLCVAGSHANLLVSRLCVRALMPIRQGGLGARSVVFVDAGNSSDIYQCVNFARQFGMDVLQVLEGMVVSRAFTIHQLAGLVAHELPKVLKRLGPKLVVVSDLLKMFVQDPQVGRKEAEWLVGEIMESAGKITGALLVMSLHGNSQYDNQVLPMFGKRIEIEQREKQLGMRLYNGRKSMQTFMPEKDLRIARW